MLKFGGNVVRREGTLEMQSSGRFNGWSLRRFTLTNSALRYFKLGGGSPGGSHEKEIALANIVAVSPAVHQERHSGALREHCFKLTLVDSNFKRHKTLLINALDDGVAREWIAAIQTARLKAIASFGTALLSQFVSIDDDDDDDDDTAGTARALQHATAENDLDRRERRARAGSAMLAASAIQGRVPKTREIMRDLQYAETEEQIVLALRRFEDAFRGAPPSESARLLLIAAVRQKYRQVSPDMWTRNVKRSYAAVLKMMDGSGDDDDEGAANHQQEWNTRRPPAELRSAWGGDNDDEDSKDVREEKGEKESSSNSPTPPPPPPPPRTRPRRSSLVALDTDLRTTASQFNAADVLGGGKFSTVIRAVNAAGVHCAIKCVKKQGFRTDDTQSDFLVECEALRRLTHPNVAKLLDSFEGTRYYYLVFPLLTGMSVMDQVVERAEEGWDDTVSPLFAEDEIRFILHATLSALAHCHANGVVHRDVKADNLLYDLRGNLVLVDFGFASCTERTHSKKAMLTMCGSVGWTAPEILRGLVYDSRVDSWSCGCLLHLAICAELPFWSENEADVLRRTERGLVQLSLCLSLASRSAHDLLAKLLCADAKLRLTAEEALSHTFLLNGDRAAPPLRPALRQETNDADDGESPGRTRFRASVHGVIFANRLQATAAACARRRSQSSQQKTQVRRKVLRGGAGPPAFGGWCAENT